MKKFISRATEGTISGAAILNNCNLIQWIPTTWSGLILKKIVLTMDGVTVGTGSSTSGCFLELTKLCRFSKFQLTLGKVDLKLPVMDTKCLLNRSDMPFLSSVMQSPSLKQLKDFAFFFSPVKDLIVFHIDLELFLLASKVSLKYSHLAFNKWLWQLCFSQLYTFFSHQKNIKSLQLWD